MQTHTKRPNRRPKLFLPLFLAPHQAATASRREPSPFPLTPDQLRRVVAERIG